VNVDQSQFRREVLNRLAKEHEVGADKFESLVPRIDASWATEGVKISPEDLDRMVHGHAEDLEKEYPLLTGIILAPYNELEEADTSDDEDDDEDEDEDDEESEDSEDDDD
jgi:hypothetical protein